MAVNATDVSALAPWGDLSADICIVGSGCGGATAAWRLAEAGHDVIVLEEGGDFTGLKLTQRGGEMYDQLYMDRGGRTTQDMSVSVLQGRALGGGGVINVCDVVSASDEVYDFWAGKYGLSDYAASSMRPHVERSLQDLGAEVIPEWMVTRANELLREGAEKLGYRGELMHHNRGDCRVLGKCMVGCPIDAKLNPRFVAIPGASEAGARFYTRARAVKISDASREIKRVEVRCLDAKGYREIGGFEVRAPVVILAANAIGSAQLLLRSGLGNGHVGRHLSLQPQLPVAAIFDEQIDASFGIPQAYAVTEFEEKIHPEHGWWGFRIEPIMGTPEMIASTLSMTGVEGKELMTLYGHVAAALLLTPDDPVGRVTVSKSGRPVVHYEQADNHKERLRQAIKAAASAYLAAGAKELIVPMARPLRIRSEKDFARVDELSLLPLTVPLISAHQQGGVRFSPDAKNGAANPDGEVYGTRQVYVFDSGGFPTSASSHTMAPIIAHSHRLSESLIARLA